MYNFPNRYYFPTEKKNLVPFRFAFFDAATKKPYKNSLKSGWGWDWGRRATF
jgi:hypothetical protein